MNSKGRAWGRWLSLAAVLALPCVLLYSSFRTLRELDEQKQVYLRERVAEIAARLETLASVPDPVSTLLESEPYLRDVEIMTSDSDAGRRPELAAIWRGRQLYRTEMLHQQGQDIYRAFIPFHRPDGLRIARIDLDNQAAEFLLLHARHNVAISLASGLTLIIVALYALWMNRRAATMEREHLEWEHLAKLGQVSAGLAHEIRNPLATIKGFAQLAAERADERGAELLAPVVSETLRLERLVNDLLLYGRPSDPSKRDVFWPEVAIELEQHCLSAASDVQLRLDRAPIRFTSDPDLLHRILLNGLRNAIDAVRNEPSPEISVDIEVERTTLIITISDNGPGIPNDVAPKLFQPFFSTKAFGAGLGLAISAQTANVLSGTVELRNRNPRGAKFTLRLANANPVPEKVSGTIHAEHPGS